MIKPALHSLTLAVFFCSGCDRKGAEKAAPPAPTKPIAAAVPPEVQNPTVSIETAERSWKDRLMDSEIIKGGLSASDQYAAKAQAMLAKVDMTQVKGQITGVVKALHAEDFADAEKWAKTLDASLDSDVLSRSIGFLKIHAQEGAAAAGKAIDEYLKVPDLSESQKAFFEKFKLGLQSRQTKKAVEFSIWALGFALEQKFPHIGGAVTSIVVRELFDAEKGVFKEYGIFQKNEPIEIPYFGEPLKGVPANGYAK